MTANGVEMDIYRMFGQVFGAVWFLIPMLIVLVIVRTPWFKGVFGEWQVNLLFRLFLPKDRYHLLKDVTLPTEDGTTQIDQILVSRYGVFVIETKNMKGWIFGSAGQRQWTQKLYKKSFKFQNPLHQNYKHLKTLESALELKPDALFSVIIFIGDSHFKTPMPENVTYARGGIRFIQSKNEVLLSEKQVRDIVCFIEQRRLQPGFDTTRRHVAHIKELEERRAGERICPQCGSGMELREGRKGKYAGRRFWGCSSYPRCRVVEKID